MGSQNQSSIESPLDEAINAFLSGDDVSFLFDYDDRNNNTNSPFPSPNMGPGEVVERALRSLRYMSSMPSEEDRGSAILLRFCAPLQRSEKWGTKYHGVGGTSEEEI